ncbi:polyketide synthase [Spartinivicinus poritis]|uniref:Polyketide synthase n=1 Tax=Spartinivicinus poritis TaxID=2994640 RepID=A0ABT5U578_9GAMM|nr:polyketide synthase [Spartinivicinus sp. A2-2]MDE1461515.1 polyketide synthase [Spartinivicinus sp. A2-2]
MAEPIAIVGIAGCYGGYQSLTDWWQAVGTIDKQRSDPAIATPSVYKLPQIDFQALIKQFRIPPVYLKTLPEVLLRVLSVTEQAILQVEQGGTINRLTSDVYFAGGQPFANICNNALRVNAVEFAATLSSVEQNLFMQAVTALPANFNDKLYELSASIASQIAVQFKFQGRAMSFDGYDLGAAWALDTAINNLRTHQSELALVCAGQVYDSTLLLSLLKLAKLIDRRQLTLGEGVGALVLMRQSDAVRQQRPILALLTGMSVWQQPGKGAFNYNVRQSLQQKIIRKALAQSEQQSITKLKHALLSSTPFTWQEEYQALSAVYQPSQPHLTCTSTVGSIGHTFACAPLAAISYGVMAMQHEQWPAIDPVANSQVVQWQHEPIISVAINSIGIGGGCAHVVLAANSPKPSATVVKPHFSPVAVVGIGVNFALGDTTEQFWRNNLLGKNTLLPLSEDNLANGLVSKDGCYDVNRSYTRLASQIQLSTMQCPAGMLPHRWLALDPSQKLAIWLTQKAIQDWELSEEYLLKQPNMGVYWGTNQSNKTARDYGATYLNQEQFAFLLDKFKIPKSLQQRWQRWLVEQLGEPGRFAFDGGLASGIPLATIQQLGIVGKTVATQAACASSLAAIDIACRALQLGEIDVALAGGLELGANHYELVLCSRMQLLSPNIITPFDVSADGFSIGEGGALFVLKRLDDSIRDGDRIYGVIRSIGASNDAISMMAPSAQGQALAIDRAFNQVDLLPRDIEFIEMHGTGTTKGDVIETQAVSNSYGAVVRQNPLYLASIKSLIGHTMAAAGAAGLLRALLAVYHGTFPHTINICQQNPSLALVDNLQAIIPTEPVPWNSQQPRRAGVNSFGTGGINYHLLVEQHL